MEYSLLVALITILMARGLGQAADVYMVLGNSMIPEHSLVNHHDFGDSEETGLRCVTERVDCCSGDNGTRAEWVDPSNIFAGGGAFLRSRNGVGSAKGYVNLFQRIQDGWSDHAQQGIYHCNIPAPSPSNAIRTLYIGIYKDNKGIPTITSITYDQLSSDMFTLTCVSTGGPATNVIWALDGSEITYDVNHVLTQTVVNTTTAEYNNTLTVTGREAGNYQCNVSNARGSDASRLFLVNFTEQPISSTEVIVASSYNHQSASSSKLMSSSITPTPLLTPPTDMSMAHNSAIIAVSAVAAILLVVTVMLSIVIVLLVLRLRLLSSSPQKNPGVEMLSGSGSIPVEECVAYGPHRGKGGGGGGGGVFYSEPGYEMGVISEQPVVGKTVLSSTTEETVYEQLD